MKRKSAGSTETTTQPNGTDLKPLLREKGYKPAEFRPLKVIWHLAFLYVILHLGAFYAIYLCIFEAQWKTIFWTQFISWLGGFGITGGAHRLYSHRSYKAKWPLRLFVAFCQTLSLSSSIASWSRYHRVHHKFTETNADPNDSRRGFFFAHAGWFLCEEQPECTKAKKEMSIDDVLRDPIAYYQHRYYVPLAILITFVFPSAVPIYFWNESIKNSILIGFVLRYIGICNVSMLVNSLAHTYDYGSHPYDKNFSPAENKVVNILSGGEGWHNYHHAFPWDYRAGELGRYGSNKTTRMIDFFAKIGWAYDLKTTSDDMIKKRVLRTGDGTHPYYNHDDYQKDEKDSFGKDGYEYMG